MFKKALFFTLFIVVIVGFSVVLVAPAIGGFVNDNGVNCYDTTSRQFVEGRWVDVTLRACPSDKPGGDVTTVSTKPVDSGTGTGGTGTGGTITQCAQPTGMGKQYTDDSVATEVICPEGYKSAGNVAYSSAGTCATDSGNENCCKTFSELQDLAGKGGYTYCVKESTVSGGSTGGTTGGTIKKYNYNLPNCTTASHYANACTACETGGDGKCGTFESTKTCTLDRIKILIFLSKLCKPKTTVEVCAITNKACADTTKVCVNNQCVDPNPTPTLTPTPTTAPTATPTDGPTPSITLTPTPTPSTICPSGETNPHFICRSNGCAQINSCGVNSGGCTQSGGICGLEDGHTYLSLIIGLDGIGSTGDNQNPQDINCTPEQRENQQCGSNWNPLKTNRDVVLELFTDSETSVSTYSSEINFTTGATNSGKFTGAIDLGTTFTGGNYVIKAKSSGYLKREFPYIQAITAAITDGPYVVNTLPGIRLVTANVNQDTSLDIRDYNLLMSCSIFSTDNNGACNQNDNYKVWSDLEDNGEIDQLDYNLLMREWVNQHEQ